MLRRLLRSLFSAGSPAEQASPLRAADQAAQAQARGDFRGAAALYESALAVRAEREDWWIRLGLCRAALGEWPAAGQAFERALRANPDSPAAHMNLGNVALATHRPTEAGRHYERALALSGQGRDAPVNAGLANNLGISLHRRGLPDRAAACFRDVLEGSPGHADALANLAFTLQHDPQASPAQVLETLRTWSEHHEQPLLRLSRPHANTRDAARRLRVGYVSGDFFRHAVANFIEPVLRHHDRTAVEVFCYHSNGFEDGETAILRGLSDHWRNITAQDDEQAALAIRADSIDILVDLSAHTQGNRLPLFARRPAPVQMSWLGYPATTGMDAIDYRITDAAADPPGVAEAFHSERLLRLPRSQWCYRPDPAAPEPGPLPALNGAPLTFGSFNNPAKINARVLELWAAVLRALPDSRITVACVSDAPSRERIAGGLAAAGARPEQVRVLGRLDAEAFWTIRTHIDAVLDSFPYNGTTTTCEALWSGLPVITLAGSHGAARNTTSLLQAVGLHDLVAGDEEQFVAIARRLAADLPALARLRAGMRRRLLGAGLCDGPRFTRELESLFRSAWQAWCEGHRL